MGKDVNVALVAVGATVLFFGLVSRPLKRWSLNESLLSLEPGQAGRKPSSPPVLPWPGPPIFFRRAAASRRLTGFSKLVNSEPVFVFRPPETLAHVRVPGREGDARSIRS